MSLKSASDFLKRVRTDEEYSKQLKSCECMPQFLELAAKTGFIFNQEDLHEADSELEEWISVGAGVWGHSKESVSHCVDYTHIRG